MASLLWTLSFCVATLVFQHVSGEGVLLVRACQSSKGEGRCVPSPECCKLVGGDVTTPDASKPCGSKEVCCYIVPTVPDSDTSCAICPLLAVTVEFQLKSSQFGPPVRISAVKGSRNSTKRLTTQATSQSTTTTKSTTPATSTTTTTNGADVALPIADESANLVRALSASSRDDDEVSLVKPVTFFARSADVGFGIPYRIERTIYDKDAMKNTYCWQVALVDSNGKVFGGGALITNSYVITAAHKVANKLPQNFQVVLGKYDFKDQEEDSRIASPLEVIVHENWDPSAFENNIALIRIPNVKCNGADICTICPSSRGMDPVTQSQDICFVTGWGSTYTKSELARLQQNQIRPVSNDDCINGLGRSGIQDFTVPKTMFCGSSSDPDRLACDGDGGAPLVCMQSGTWAWELRGLVALGVSQCVNVTDAPTVYTDVGKLSGWIVKKLQQLDEEIPPWMSTTQRTTTLKTTTTAAPLLKAPVLNRRTNDNPMSSYVFPSYLRHLDDNVDTYATAL